MQGRLLMVRLSDQIQKDVTPDINSSLSIDAR